MYEIKKHKTELRTRYLAERDALDKSMRAAWDARICRSLLSGVSYRFSDILLLYYPKAGEIDILPIFRAALDAGKRVAFPRCNPEDRSMVFHFVTSEGDLEKGAYGIMEPRGDLPIFDTENAAGQSVLCLVPAVIYDREGYRIGYGGGYYDRFFGRYKPITVGVAYESLIVDHVPHGRFDVRVDVVVSERGIYAK